MIVQRISLCELAVAELASVFLDPGVHVHVVLKTGYPVESLPTLFTHIWLDIWRRMSFSFLLRNSRTYLNVSWHVVLVYSCHGT